MRPGLSRNIAASVFTAGTLIGTSALSVPIILNELGTAGFGVWSLAITAVVYVTLAEGGIGPAVQRFVAVASGADDTATVHRLVWSSLALYLVVGLVVVAVLAVTAPAIVGALDVPAGLEQDAEAMFRVTGLAMMGALLVAALGNAVQGLERFLVFAVTSAAGAAVFLGVGTGLLLAGEGLEGLAWAAVGQQLTMLVGRAWSLRDIVSWRPALADRSTVRAVASFSLRLQASLLSVLANSQTDKVVVGLVAPAATLGQVSIGAQVAESGRLVAGSALSPMISRLASMHAGGDAQALGALYDRLNRLWVVMVLGMTAVGVGSIQPLIAGWLGEGYGDAGLFGAVLVLGYGVSLLPSVALAYLRAVGRPGYEARYGLITVALNVVGTVTLGLTVGVVGVIVATAVAYLVATGWFVGRVAEALPASARVLPISPRGVVTTAVAGAAAFGWGIAMTELLPRGVSLIPLVGGAAIVLVGHIGATTGVWPTRANLRALVS